MVVTFKIKFHKIFRAICICLDKLIGFFASLVPVVHGNAHANSLRICFSVLSLILVSVSMLVRSLGKIVMFFRGLIFIINFYGFEHCLICKNKSLKVNAGDTQTFSNKKVIINLCSHMFFSFLFPAIHLVHLS